MAQTTSTIGEQVNQFGEDALSGNVLQQRFSDRRIEFLVNQLVSLGFPGDLAQALAQGS